MPHVRQITSWDCGIACAVAVIAARSGAPAADRADALRRIHAALDHNSIWTIEIFLLLHANGIPGVLRSVNLGVTASHAGLSYYSQLATDSGRVTAQFAQARELGLDMREEPVEVDYICERLLNRQAIFVALVDYRYLSCTRCWPPTQRLGVSYAGHYVVCHAYDPEHDEVGFMDPNRACTGGADDEAAATACCWAKTADFERARKAEGTDEDIIELPLASLRGDGVPLVTSIAALASAATAGAAAGAPVAAAAATSLTATLVPDDSGTAAAPADVAAPASSAPAAPAAPVGTDAASATATSSDSSSSSGGASACTTS